MHPHLVAAVLRDIQLDMDILNSLMDFMDKLQRNVGRNHTLVIRAQDLDKIKDSNDTVIYLASSHHQWRSIQSVFGDQKCLDCMFCYRFKQGKFTCTV